MEIDFTNLQEVIAYLAGPAGLLAMGIVISDLLRNLKVDWWVKLEGVYRTIIMVGVYVLAAVAVFAVQEFVPAEFIAKIAPYYAKLVMIYFAGRGIFEVSKNR